MVEALVQIDSMIQGHDAFYMERYKSVVCGGKESDLWNCTSGILVLAKASRKLEEVGICSKFIQSMHHEQDVWQEPMYYPMAWFYQNLIAPLTVTLLEIQ